MKAPKISKVNFFFGNVYSIRTKAPFTSWHIYEGSEFKSAYTIHGRKDVTKRRAIRILNKYLKDKDESEQTETTTGQTVRKFERLTNQHGGRGD